MFGEIGDFFERVDKHHSEQREAFERLCIDPCSKFPQAGDRVIVAAGLLGRGFEWIREEATVLEVGDTSVHISFGLRKICPEYPGQLDTKWIHPCLITDVLPPPEETP